ncbi:MAG: cupin domain-containing protein [Actinomycetota bacterium]|nr:cupin domain-containing protein [Actinomycetota bacterium]
MSPDDGEAYWILGGLYTYRALAEQVGGGYTAVEVRARDGMAIPVHHHDAETEAFYVADGAVTVLVGEQEVPAEQGAFVWVPPGVDHAFRFEADGRMLLLFTGGVGHEGLFREIGEPAVSRTIPPPLEDAPDPEQMAALAARFGTRIVGPPFARDGAG